jgi:tripartite ATP-independent transporter DctM subunit
MFWVLVTFAVLLLMGMPVAFAIGIAGCVFFLQHPELPSTIPIQLAISQTQNFALLAIPLFIMAGNLLNHSGITRELLNLASVIAGRLRGGLAQVSIVLASLMGGVSGSAIADAAMQARMIGGEMLKRGFSRGYAGIGFILYGTVGQVSIGRLFAAGFVPAFLLWAAMALTISFTAKRRGYEAERKARPSVKETARALRGGIWALLFPVFLLVGLRFGIFTPSEIGAFAVVYALLVGLFAYRMLRRASLREALEGSLVDVGAVMFLIALSGIFGYGIVFERVPEAISQAILGVSDDADLVLMLIVALIIAAGCFIDGTVLIIMLTPIFLPLVQQMGVDPVHFGLIFVIAVTIGNFTPPVGAAMFAVCSILKCPVGEYTRESLPFLAAVSAVTLFLIFVPEVVLFLPDLLFGRDR